MKRSPLVSRLVSLIAITMLGVWRAEAQSPALGNLPIRVNGRLVAEAFSIVQDGRALLPVTRVARALGDEVEVDTAARRIVVRRQNGIVTEFRAALGQVRENGAPILVVNAAPAFIFPPTPEELMLPVEIVSALLDVAIIADASGSAIDVNRGLATTAVRTGNGRSWVDFQTIDHDYNLNRTGATPVQTLTLRATGRLGTGGFSFATHSTGTGANLEAPASTTLRYEHANGARVSAGDVGTGADLQFISTALRGGSATVPIKAVELTTFGGRSRATTRAAGIQPAPASEFDTDVVGAFTVFGRPRAPAATPNRAMFASGILHFDGPARSGDMFATAIRRTDPRRQLEADFGFGQFNGTRQDDTRVAGSSSALNLKGSFNVSSKLVLLGRYEYMGKTFLEPSGGGRTPLNAVGGGASTRPFRWLDASLSMTVGHRTDLPDTRERSGTTTVRLNPAAFLPTIFLSHTASSSGSRGVTGFTMANVSQAYSRGTLLGTVTRTVAFGTATLFTQVGGTLDLNRRSTLQLSQGFAAYGSRTGNADWQASSMFRDRISIGAGVGYTKNHGTPMETTRRLFATLRLPREHTLQVTYVHDARAPQFLVSVRGATFRPASRRMDSNASVETLGAFSTIRGRLYQDINLNGRFDRESDKPLTNVTVRMDGNRFGVSDTGGEFTIDTVQAGAHAVYVDLMTVRADLTSLDGLRHVVQLVPEREGIVDFRFVRTGRVSGRVWFDENRNDQIDDGEPALADVRIVAASGRDTLTDLAGGFVIGDLPPGDHTLVVDEKTLPPNTRAAAGSRTVRVRPGAETANILIAITEPPAEIKRFERRPR